MSDFPHQERQSFRKWQWLSFAFLALLNLLVYSQSFLHIARSDQVNYLAEVANKHDWIPLAIQSYDLNRHREFAPGDELLFRPVVYFILGTEKYLFGYQFMYWQITAMLFHLAVIWVLLKLLLTIHRGIFAVLLTGFFSLLYINMEMVTWHHISSYMIFTALILAVLYQVYVYTQKGETQKWRLWVMTICLLIAVFTYEAGNIYALMIFVFLWLSCPDRRQRKAFFILCLPVVIYAIASVSNFYLTQVTAPEGHKMVNCDLVGMFKDFLVTVAWFLYAGLFPSQLDIVCGVRHMISRITALLPPLNFGDVAVLLAFVLIFLYILVIKQSLTRDFLKKQGRFLLLLMAMMAIYIVVIALGREHSRGLQLILRRNLYYHYLFWAFGIVWLYASVNFKVLLERPLLKWLRGTGVVVLSVLIILNSILVWRMVKEQADRTNSTVVLMRIMDLLIKDHGKEPDFSLYVDTNYPGNFIMPELTKRGDPPGKRYNFIELIYPQYYTRNSPKYIFIPGTP